MLLVRNQIFCSHEIDCWIRLVNMDRSLLFFPVTPAHFAHVRRLHVELFLDHIGAKLGFYPLPSFTCEDPVALRADSDTKYNLKNARIVKCSCSVFFFSTEEPYPSSSIDLKCKERVTDSDSENGSGDESDRKVSAIIVTPVRSVQCLLSNLI